MDLVTETVALIEVLEKDVNGKLKGMPCIVITTTLCMLLLQNVYWNSFHQRIKYHILAYSTILFGSGVLV